MFKNPDLHLLVTNQTSMSNFHPFEVVGHGSKTQLQMSNLAGKVLLKIKKMIILCLTRSIPNLPVSSSFTTSRELLSQFSTCSE